MLRPITYDQLTLRAYGVIAQYLNTTHVLYSYFGDLQRTQQAVIQSIKPAGPRVVVPSATVDLTDQEDKAVAKRQRTASGPAARAGNCARRSMPWRSTSSNSFCSLRSDLEELNSLLER